MGKKPCCSYVGMKKGLWTPEEDFRLIKCIQIHGEGNWRTLPLKAGLLRCGKACRLRWMNYLRPDIKRGHISADEEDLILRLHKLVGNRWSLIAGRIPGRTDNEIKNHWNTHLSKRLEPRSHGNIGSRIVGIQENSRSLLGTKEVHKEPMQNFKQISDGYDFSIAFNNVGGAPWPPPLTSTMGTSAGYENINNSENLAGSGNNLQLDCTMLGAECSIQILSNSSTMVEYDNSLESMQNFELISDGYDALTTINDFSNSFKQISDGYDALTAMNDFSNSFKQISDGYDALTAINDFSNSFKQISDGYGDHQFSSMPMPFISATATSAGYANIIEDINTGENLLGRESNMQLRSTLLGAESSIQLPSRREEIDDAEANKGETMVVNSSTITAGCWEPFSALSDWLNEPNDYILSVEDYC